MTDILMAFMIVPVAIGCGICAYIILSAFQNRKK